MRRLLRYWWLKAVRASGRSSLSAKAAFVFASRVGGAGLAFAVQVCFARWAGAEAYGVYSYAMAWAMLLSLFATLGFPQAAVRFLPAYQEQENWSPMRGFIKSGERVVLAAGGVVAGIGTLVLVLFGGLAGTMDYVLLVAFWSIPFLALLKFQSALCRAFHQVDLAYGVPRLVRPLFMMGGGGVVVAWQSSLTGLQVTLLVAASVLPVWGWQRWQFRRRRPAPLASAQPARAFRAWLRVSLPLLWIGGMLVVLNQTDLLMIGAFLEPREAGFYKAATRMATGTTFVLAALNAVAAPRFAALHAAGNQDALRRLVQRLAHWIFWPSLALTLVLCLFADVLLGIFGPAFPTARWALIILALGHLVNAGTGPVGYLLNMTDYQRASARVMGWSVLLNVALNALGIYLFGLTGAALATALCTVLWNVWMYHLVARKLHLRPSIVAALKPLLSRRETPA